MRKVILIPIFNLTLITPRTVQSHLYDHGYTTLISDLELYHWSNHVAFHYLSKEMGYVLYKLLCKKMTIYSKFNRRYFFACVTKNQNPLSTCSEQLICKTSYLEICRRSYLYNIPLWLPPLTLPTWWPTVFTISITGFFHWKTRFKSYEKFNDDKGEAEMNLFV